MYSWQTEFYPFEPCWPAMIASMQQITHIRALAIHVGLAFSTAMLGSVTCFVWPCQLAQHNNSCHRQQLSALMLQQLQIQCSLKQLYTKLALPYTNVILHATQSRKVPDSAGASYCCLQIGWVWSRRSLRRPLLLHTDVMHCTCT